MKEAKTGPRAARGILRGIHDTETEAAAISVGGFQEIDVHNMTRTQAIAAIDAKLRRTGPSVYRLRVIHGYHSGTALRDAVRTYYRKHPKVKRIEITLNPGETDLVLREL